MIRLPGWLPSSPALAAVAPRGSLIGPSRRGGSPHRVLRTSARPRAVGRQQSGPSSYGTVRSAGADVRLGGLQSGLLEHALGDVRGGTRGLRRHPGLHGRHGAVHRCRRIGAVSIWLPLSNHAVQRTPGARHFVVKQPAVGGAPGAADGERWADNGRPLGSTLDGGENCSWGEEHLSSDACDGFDGLASRVSGLVAKQKEATRVARIPRIPRCPRGWQGRLYERGWRREAVRQASPVSEVVAKQNEAHRVARVPRIPRRPRVWRRWAQHRGW